MLGSAANTARGSADTGFAAGAAVVAADLQQWATTVAEDALIGLRAADVAAFLTGRTARVIDAVVPGVAANLAANAIVSAACSA